MSTNNKLDYDDAVEILNEHQEQSGAIVQQPKKHGI